MPPWVEPARLDRRSWAQQADNLGERQDHLDVRVLFGGESAELLHGPLFFNLVSSLRSDSLLFLGPLWAGLGESVLLRIQSPYFENQSVRRRVFLDRDEFVTQLFGLPIKLGLESLFTLRIAGRPNRFVVLQLV